MTKPGIQSLIKSIEQEVLSWDGLSAGGHAMGGTEFLFRGKEIGHIHWNGDLDILFGKQLTEDLLSLQGVQRHRYVPAAGITFPLHNASDIPFAVSLLRLSCLRRLKRIQANNPGLAVYIESERNKLPVELKMMGVK